MMTLLDDPSPSTMKLPQTPLFFPAPLPPPLPAPAPALAPAPPQGGSLLKLNNDNDNLEEEKGTESLV